MAEDKRRNVENNIVKRVKESFPNKLLDNFNKWKVPELRQFLIMTANTKSTSTMNKNTLVELATKTWTITTQGSQEAGCSESNLQASNLPEVTADRIERYPRLSNNMNEADFNTWNIHQLQAFLGDRGINRSGNKAKLVKNAYGTYKMNLPIVSTNVAEELDSVKTDKKSKLILEDGLVILPDPKGLIDNWVIAPSLLPDTLYSDVENYLKQHEAGKAFQGGKSLLLSGHVFNVMVHTISPSIRYCFVKGLCHAEQKFKTKKPYEVWVSVHKDSGQIKSADCMCVAG